MAQDLPDFIDVLAKCAADPAYSIYLPYVVLEQTLPADPFAVGGLDFGDLGTIDATVPTRLCAALGSGRIANPATAVMTLANMAFLRGSAAQPLDFAVNGQTVTGTISFDSGTAIPGLPAPGPLQLAADIRIELQCCPSGDGTICSGSPEPTSFAAPGSVLTFGAASLGFTITVDDTFTVVATSLVFIASDLSAVIASSRGAANQIVNDALTSAAGTAAIIAQVNDALNRQATLTAIGTKLTPAFQTLSNPSILSWLIGELYDIATDPRNQNYLPAVLEGATDPTLEPYTVSGSWSLGDMSQSLGNAGALICSGYPAPPGTYMIQSPGTQIPLMLDNIVITGLSNALLKPMLTVGDEVQALALFGQIADWPHQLAVSGDFTLGVTCCPTKDGTTCSVPSGASTGTGTFSIAIGAASGAGSVSIAVAGKSLTATIDRIFFRASGLQSTINITSVPEGQQSVWNAQAEKAFDSAQATNMIIGNIQQQMNDQNVLDAISGMINQALARLEPGTRERLTADIQARRGR